MLLTAKIIDLNAKQNHKFKTVFKWIIENAAAAKYQIKMYVNSQAPPELTKMQCVQLFINKYYLLDNYLILKLNI